MGKPLETPDAEIITTLQNRINDLEADLKAEKDSRAAAPKFERKDFDDGIAKLKSEIEEWKREIKALQKTESESQNDDNAGESDAWGDFASGVHSLSIFPEE